MDELNIILEKFVSSGWDLIARPSKDYLEGKNNKDELVEVIKKADLECGSCGCELDPLYKTSLELLK